MNVDAVLTMIRSQQYAAAFLAIQNALNQRRTIAQSKNESTVGIQHVQERLLTVARNLTPAGLTSALAVVARLAELPNTSVNDLDAIWAKPENQLRDKVGTIGGWTMPRWLTDMPRWATFASGVAVGGIVVAIFKGR